MQSRSVKLKCIVAEKGQSRPETQCFKLKAVFFKVLVLDNFEKPKFEFG